MLAALLRPDQYFGDRSGDFSLAVAALIVFVCALVVTTAIGVAFSTVTGQMTGTTTIDNPERPPEWVCDQDSEGTTDPTVGCSQPEQKTVELGTLVWREARGMLPFLFVGVFLVWGLKAVSLHVASAFAGGRGSFADTLTVTAYGFVPSTVATVVALAILAIAARQAPLSASDPDTILRQLDAFVTTIRPVLVGIGLLGVVWETYVAGFGIKHARNVATTPAMVVTGLVSLVFYLVAVA